MRTTLIALMLLITNCTSAFAQCRTLPEVVQQYLRSEPGWSVVDSSDLVPADNVLWERYHAGLCPGMAVVDLDGAGQPSYGLALLNRESGQEKLVILRHQPSGFSADLVVPPTSVSSANIISPRVVWRVGAGNFRDRENGQITRVSHDAVVYEKLEATATAYYLEDGRYRSILTSN